MYDVVKAWVPVGFDVDSGSWIVVCRWRESSKHWAWLLDRQDAAPTGDTLVVDHVACCGLTLNGMTGILGLCMGFGR